MKLCNRCGAQNSDESTYCGNCGNALDQQNSLNPTPVAAVYTPEPEPAPVPTPPPAPTPAPKKKKSKLWILLIVIPLVLGIVFAVLVATHVICLKHDWSVATCTSASFCYECGRVDGVAPGHQFDAATCTTPKTCKVCQHTEGEALGHTEGDWVVTLEPTLVATGVKVMNCTVCETELDSGSVPVKEPQIQGASFNFKDEEYLAWLEDHENISTIYTFGRKNLMDEGEEKTSYSVTLFNGTTGIIMFQHDEEGYINTVACMFTDEANAMIMASFLAECMDARCEPDAVLDQLMIKGYYMKDKLIVMSSDYESLYIGALTTFDHFGEALG